MIESLFQFSQKRGSWFILMLAALSLELTALYFQYGMDLHPCILCVYQRTAVAGIFLAGLIGLASPATPWIRWLGLMLWAGSAIWGLSLTIEHVAIQTDPTLAGECEFLANYPNWFKLDEWLPTVFEPTGSCDEIQWRFLGFTMPQSMLGIFAFFLLVLLPVLVSQFQGKRTI